MPRHRVVQSPQALSSFFATIKLHWCHDIGTSTSHFILIYSFRLRRFRSVLSSHSTISSTLDILIVFQLILSANHCRSQVESLWKISLKLEDVPIASLTRSESLLSNFTGTGMSGESFQKSTAIRLMTWHCYHLIIRKSGLTDPRYHSIHWQSINIIA